MISIIYIYILLGFLNFVGLPSDFFVIIVVTYYCILFGLYFFDNKIIKWFSCVWYAIPYLIFTYFILEKIITVEYITISIACFYWSILLFIFRNNISKNWLYISLNLRYNENFIAFYVLVYIIIFILTTVYFYGTINELILINCNPDFNELILMNSDLGNNPGDHLPPNNNNTFHNNGPNNTPPNHNYIDIDLLQSRYKYDSICHKILFQTRLNIGYAPSLQRNIYDNFTDSRADLTYDEKCYINETLKDHDDYRISTRTFYKNQHLNEEVLHTRGSDKRFTVIPKPSAIILNDFMTSTSDQIKYLRIN